MTYGISEISIIPVRKESNRQSEMTSQILFGETFQVLEEITEWCFIKTNLDNYEGWINSSSISQLSDINFEKIAKDKQFVVTNLYEEIINTTDNSKALIPFGSTLPNFDLNQGSFFINSHEYKIEKYIPETNRNLIERTKLFLNAPYLWGGRNPFGIDCSGYTQIIYKTLGIILPRDAKDQVKIGTTINFIGDTKAGDLAFFDDTEGNITHVGIILEQNKIIHSSVKVRIDHIDQQGIYNMELKKYTHKLRIIKRLK
jgi:cell wall-associated NlpC family hydrolase